MRRPHPSSALPVRPLAALALALAASACSDGTAATDTAAGDVTAETGDAGDTVGPPAPTLSTDGLALDHGPASVVLLPRVKVGGAWRGGGLDGACAVSDEVLRCPAGPAGHVEATFDDGLWRARFFAAETIAVEGLSLSGLLVLPGATTFLSNGAQSWSQSGPLALGPPLPTAQLDEALRAEGDAEVLRDGRTVSWWMTWVAGAELAFVAGVPDVVRWPAWAHVTRTGSDDHSVHIGLELVSGARGETLTVEAGASVDAEGWQLAIGPDLDALLLAYADALPDRREAHPHPAEAGWNSWYELWDSVTEEAVRANAARARTLLGPLLPDAAPPLRVVIDDGWQVGWGDWRVNDKFPSGLDKLAADLRMDGFTVGLWLAPLLVAADSPLATENPTWFVGGASYPHLKNGTMRILDVTHPEAAAHLDAVIRGLVAQGIDLLKIDFLFAGTQPGARHAPVTAIESYRTALAIIREAAGESTLLLAVGAPPLPTLGFVDAWRVGPDIAVEPLGAAYAFLPNELRAIAARWPFCHATLCDGDPPLLRDLPRNEVALGGLIAASAGGAYFLSDDLRALSDERFGWGVDAEVLRLGLLGLPAHPLDPVPAAPPATLASGFVDQLLGVTTHVVPAHWRFPDGTEVILNTADTPLTHGAITVQGRSAVFLPGR